MHAIDTTASDGGVSCDDASIGRSAEEAPAEPGLRPPSALISGGSRGVGLAIGERLAARGYSLTIAARDPDRLTAAAAALRAAGAHSVATVATDLGQDSGVHAVVAGTPNNLEALTPSC
jgi:short-subunit dehydrogenase